MQNNINLFTISTVLLYCIAVPTELLQTMMLVHYCFFSTKVGLESTPNEKTHLKKPFLKGNHPAV